MHTLSGSISNAKKYSATEYQTDNQYIYISFGSVSFHIGIYLFFSYRLHELFKCLQKVACTAINT